MRRLAQRPPQSQLPPQHPAAAGRGQSRRRRQRSLRWCCSAARRPTVRGPALVGEGSLRLLPAADAAAGAAACAGDGHFRPSPWGWTPLQPSATAGGRCRVLTVSTLLPCLQCTACRLLQLWAIVRSCGMSTRWGAGAALRRMSWHLGRGCWARPVVRYAQPRPCPPCPTCDHACFVSFGASAHSCLLPATCSGWPQSACAWYRLMTMPLCACWTKRRVSSLGPVCAGQRASACLCAACMPVATRRAALSAVARCSWNVRAALPQQHHGHPPRLPLGLPPCRRLVC